MLDLRSPWFDVALVLAIFAVGNILFGHFEEHKPKALRVLKVVVVTGVVGGLSFAGLRSWAYGILAAFGVAAVYVHGWWLPRHGVNGLTGEPRERYDELLGIQRRPR